MQYTPDMKEDQPVQQPQRGLPVVLAGPSGVGKSTIFQRILAERDDCVLSVSATTRAPRGDEQDGVAYHFMDVATFEQGIAQGDFIEYAQVFDRDYYGTPKPFILEQTALGRNVLLDIDVQGAAQLKHGLGAGSGAGESESVPLSDIILIFLLPPSMTELERRLRSRQTDSEAAIQKRLQTAADELACLPEFDFQVVNQDIDQAVREVHAIITASRCRINP